MNILFLHCFNKIASEITQKRLYPFDFLYQRPAPAVDDSPAKYGESQAASSSGGWYHPDPPSH